MDETLRPGPAAVDPEIDLATRAISEYKALLTLLDQLSEGTFSSVTLTTGWNKRKFVIFPEDRFKHLQAISALVEKLRAMP